MVSVLAKRFLSDCNPQDAFWANNGSVCRNIYELATCISGMNDATFLYHVNGDNVKNDFAKWIREVLGDDILSQRLSDVKEKDRYIDIIRQRINEEENS